MSHFAKLDENNIVTFVIKARQESDGMEDEFTQSTGEVWKQTSYNTRGGVHYNPETGEPSDDQTKALRFNYAGIGFTYDEDRDAFIPPKPFESWVLNNYTCLWEAPEPYPTDGESYVWDEEVTDWVVVPSE
jgi:hypothetical protein